MPKESVVEQTACLKAVRESDSSDLQVTERRLLDKLLALLEAKIADGEANTIRPKEKQDTQLSNDQSLLMSLINAWQDNEPGWVNDTKLEASPKTVEPEVANLIHFLVRIVAERMR
jgi:hypothetical protein